LHSDQVGSFSSSFFRGCVGDHHVRWPGCGPRPVGGHQLRRRGALCPGDSSALLLVREPPPAVPKWWPSGHHGSHAARQQGRSSSASTSSTSSTSTSSASSSDEQEAAVRGGPRWCRTRCRHVQRHVVGVQRRVMSGSRAPSPGTLCSTATTTTLKSQRSPDSSGDLRRFLAAMSEATPASSRCDMQSQCLASVDGRNVALPLQDVTLVILHDALCRAGAPAMAAPMARSDAGAACHQSCRC
jgi:hypothetical protein